MENLHLHSALGSATAGIISRIFTHPLDTAKARIQATISHASARHRHPLHVISNTFRYEGIRGLYRGFGAILVGGTPGTMMYLCSYDIFKSSLSALTEHKKSENENTASTHAREFSIHFTSGMLAETVACIIYVPVDVIKERLQVQSLVKQGDVTVNSEAYRGSWDALKKIMRTEGFSGIYKGYGATLASFGPFSAFCFMFYEQFKLIARDFEAKQNKQTDEQSADISFPLLLACSCCASAAASWITSPLDMAKLRLQIQRGGLHSTNIKSSPGQTVTIYKGMMDCLRITYARAGIRGIFQGSVARVMHVVPATTITFSCYEKCRSFYADRLSS